MGSFSLSLQLKVPAHSCPVCSGLAPPAAAATPPPASGTPVPQVKLGAHQVDATEGTATFRFVSPTAGATFVCKLDAKAYRACASPFKAKGLEPGKHVFRVLAMLGGTAGASPAVVHFTVRPRHWRQHRAG